MKYRNSHINTLIRLVSYSKGSGEDWWVSEDGNGFTKQSKIWMVGQTYSWSCSLKIYFLGMERYIKLKITTWSNVFAVQSTSKLNL